MNKDLKYFLLTPSAGVAYSLIWYFIGYVAANYYCLYLLAAIDSQLFTYLALSLQAKKRVLLVAKGLLCQKITI